jgi:hypothetical protein
VRIIVTVKSGAPALRAAVHGKRTSLEIEVERALLDHFRSKFDLWPEDVELEVEERR